MLILLRHGRTAHNAASVLQGETDPPLDDLGVEQAARAGDYIRDRWDIDTVVTSSLQRTRQTAELAGFTTATHEVDDRWREISFGEFEGRKLAEVVGELDRRWRADIGYEPEGGESLGSVHRRVSEACHEVIERARDENILVVSHATPIKSAVIWATGGEPGMILNLWVTPGSVSVLDKFHGSVVLAEFNRRLDH